MDLGAAAVFFLCSWPLGAVPEGTLMFSSIDLCIRGDREVNFELEPGVSSYDPNEVAASLRNLSFQKLLPRSQREHLRRLEREKGNPMTFRLDKVTVVEADAILREYIAGILAEKFSIRVTPAGVHDFVRRRRPANSRPRPEGREGTPSRVTRPIESTPVVTSDTQLFKFDPDEPLRLSKPKP